jgi:hypothetical protein
MAKFIKLTRTGPEARDTWECPYVLNLNCIEAVEPYRLKAGDVQDGSLKAQSIIRTTITDCRYLYVTESTEAIAAMFKADKGE